MGDWVSDECALIASLISLDSIAPRVSTLGLELFAD
jgi:hypothetical protein